MMDAAIWTSFSRSYDEVLRNWSCYQELGERVLDVMGACRRVLDQGCGTGLLAIALADRGKEVHGIDVNPDMLGYARRAVRDAGRTDVHLRLGDAQSLDFPDGSFDGVVCNNVVFFVPDPLRLVGEAYRVLRPSGIFVVSGPVHRYDFGKLTRHIEREFDSKRVGDPTRRALGDFVEMSAALRSEGMPNTYTAGEMVDLLREVGFRREVAVSSDMYLGESFFVAMSK